MSRYFGIQRLGIRTNEEICTDKGTAEMDNSAPGGVDQKRSQLTH